MLNRSLDNLTRDWRQSRRLVSCGPVTGVATDSRQVQPGHLFVAIEGYSADGHDFIPEAIARGATAVVYQDDHDASAVPDDVSAIGVLDSRRAAAEIAADFWGDPSNNLTLVGVTGTNGKTTTAFLVDSIFQASGASTGLLSTPARFIAGAQLTADRTTPDSVELQGLLAEMRAAGVTHVVLEVSSHGLALDRTWMCKFDAAIFTNLSQDHLDFHANLEEYYAAKLRLFTDYPELGKPHKSTRSVVNIDDPAGVRICEQTRADLVTYGLGEAAMVTASDSQVTPTGLQFRLVLPEASPVPVRLRLVGGFNLHNALAAAACGWGLGIATGQIVAGLEQLSAVPGRFERIDKGQDFTVIVDYAHTPDALENVLESARALQADRLICVFGCGGDRDRGKRPEMGRIATALADFTIITSDNPRSEVPYVIIDEIVAGATGDTYSVEADRRQAIFTAVEQCRPGDILVIAGKGHESYQIIGDKTIPFDDREVVREALIRLDSKR